MTALATRWLDTSGPAGSLRPHGPAELVRGVDRGLAAVRYVYDALRIDPWWSVGEDRGFTWWAGSLAQRVWSEPGLDDRGVLVYRLHAQTDLARGVDAGLTTKMLNVANMSATTSALVVEPERSRLAYHASVWVHAGTLGWLSRLFATVAMLQAVDAHAKVDSLALLLGGEPHASAHPFSGARGEPDEMLGLGHLVAFYGKQPSRWSGREQTYARAQLAPGPMAALTNGDESGISMELPFGGQSCLLQSTTTDAHPAIGSGMLVRLTLPSRAVPSADASTAGHLNRLELRSGARSHFLGSWVARDGVLSHVTFLPNLLKLDQGDALNLLRSEHLRARWVAGELAAVR